MMPTPESSRVSRLGFEPNAQNSLMGRVHVVFTDGSRGHYEDVPIHVFRQFRDSSSKGRALDRLLIRPGYRFVTDPAL